MFPVLTTVGSAELEVLFPFEGKGEEDTSTRETERFLSNLKLHTLPGNLGILMLVDHKVKKGVTTLAG